MSYEQAPATVMLATHCAACARPLVDAVSVERGLGPFCAEKYGFNASVDTGARAIANAIVSMIARSQRPEAGIAKSDVDGAVDRLRAIGFVRLADVVAKRLANKKAEKFAIEITTEGDKLLVKTPFSERFNELAHKIHGCYFDGSRKVRVWPITHRRSLWQALCIAFPEGELVKGPNGVKPLVKLERKVA